MSKIMFYKKKLFDTILLSYIKSYFKISYIKLNRNKMSNPILITITGPSCSGKSFLTDKLSFCGYSQLISTTTRPPRENEKNNQHYIFLSQKEFDIKLKNNEFVENVVYDGFSYGILAESIKDASMVNKNCVLVAEPHGVEQISQYCNKHNWTHIKIFLNCPLDLITKRFLTRFLNETKNITNQEVLDSKITSSSKRIQKILRFEQDHWVMPAITGAVEYDLIFDKFDLETEKEVIDEIRGFVFQFSQSKHQSKNKTSQKQLFSTK